jgi:hypothetical protein
MNHAASAQGEKVEEERQAKGLQEEEEKVVAREPESAYT